MATDNPSQTPIVIRPPTRLVATNGGGSTAYTLPANGRLDFIGSNGRQDRIQIVVTNMDAALYIYWAKLNGDVCGAIFAQLPWTLETSADITLINPNGSDVAIFVAELYPDTGNKHGVPSPRVASTGGTTSGGTTSGGTTSGGSSTSGGTGGSLGGSSGGTAQPR